MKIYDYQFNNYVILNWSLTNDIIDIQHLLPGVNIGEDTVPDLWGSDFDQMAMFRYWEF